MRTKTSSSRVQHRKRAARGANPPPVGSRRFAGDRDALEYDRGAPNDRARAARRSVGRTGMTSTGASSFEGKSTRMSKRSRRDQRATDRARDQPAASPQIPKKQRARLSSPAAAGHKGGPGKRRPYPKKTAAR